MTQKDFDFDCGLVRYKRWLVWGCDHGALLHWPHWFKLWMVSIWNFTACRLFGHDMDTDDGVCYHCCYTDPTAVIERDQAVTYRQTHKGGKR